MPGPAIAALQARAAAHPGRCGVCLQPLPRNTGTRDRWVCRRLRCVRARNRAYQIDHRGGPALASVERIEKIHGKPGRRRVVLSCGCSREVIASKADRASARCPTHSA